MSWSRNGVDSHVWVGCKQRLQRCDVVVVTPSRPASTISARGLARAIATSLLRPRRSRPDVELGLPASFSTPAEREAPWLDIARIRDDTSFTPRFDTEAALRDWLTAGTVE
ncbi:MAG TPA: hypothetical protein VH143_27975 [Kofleriaceae bacterium]|nr:hypothetical protein [Kofleriaceae bacterium]